MIRTTRILVLLSTYIALGDGPKIVYTVETTGRRKRAEMTRTKKKTQKFPAKKGGERTKKKMVGIRRAPSRLGYDEVTN